MNIRIAWHDMLLAKLLKSCEVRCLEWLFCKTCGGTKFLSQCHEKYGFKLCDHSKSIESKSNWSQEQSVTIFFIFFKENHSFNHFQNSGRIDVYFATFSGNKWAFLQVEDERKPQLEGQFSGKGFQCLCFPKVSKREKKLCSNWTNQEGGRRERGNEK